MAQMHEITLFAGITQRRGLFSWKGLWIFDIAPTKEIEWPYRKCNHSFVLRLWSGKALVVGRWNWSGLSEAEALIEAMEGINLGFQGQGIKESVKEAGTD